MSVFDRFVCGYGGIAHIELDLVRDPRETHDVNSDSCTNSGAYILRGS
jgi:hypothetical protein